MSAERQDMLGSVIRACASLHPGYIATVLELFGYISICDDDSDLEAWRVQIKRFLRREPCRRPESSLYHEVLPSLAGVTEQRELSKDRSLGILSACFQHFSDGDLRLVKDLVRKISDENENEGDMWSNRRNIELWLAGQPCWKR
jgi:hypothetical protein